MNSVSCPAIVARCTACLVRARDRLRPAQRRVRLLRLMGVPSTRLRRAHRVPIAMATGCVPATAVPRRSAGRRRSTSSRVGTFKSLHIAEDGYEQVLGFAGRGEVLGYDALCQGLHPTTAVALEDSTVYSLALPDVFSALPAPAGARSRAAPDAEPRPDAPGRDRQPDGRRVGRSAPGALPGAAVGAHGRTRPVAAAPSAAHEPARHREPHRRRARDGEPLVRRADAPGAGCACATARSRSSICPGLKQFSLNTRRAVDEGIHLPAPRPELRLCAT